MRHHYRGNLQFLFGLHEVFHFFLLTSMGCSKCKILHAPFLLFSMYFLLLTCLLSTSLPSLIRLYEICINIQYDDIHLSGQPFIRNRYFHQIFRLVKLVLQKTISFFSCVWSTRSPTFHMVNKCDGAGGCRGMVHILPSTSRRIADGEPDKPLLNTAFQIHTDWSNGRNHLW